MLVDWISGCCPVLAFQTEGMGGIGWISYESHHRDIDHHGEISPLLL